MIRKIIFAFIFILLVGLVYSQVQSNENVKWEAPKNLANSREIYSTHFVKCPENFDKQSIREKISKLPFRQDISGQELNDMFDACKQTSLFKVEGAFLPSELVNCKTNLESELTSHFGNVPVSYGRLVEECMIRNESLNNFKKIGISDNSVNSGLDERNQYLIKKLSMEISEREKRTGTNDLSNSVIKEK